MSAAQRVHRGTLVFDDVLPLEPPRAVHRQEPARDVTHGAEDFADREEDGLADEQWFCADLFENAADELAVMALFVLDLMDPRALFGVSNAAPVSGVRELSGELARIRVLQL